MCKTPKVVLVFLTECKWSPNATSFNASDFRQIYFHLFAMNINLGKLPHCSTGSYLKF